MFGLDDAINIVAANTRGNDIKMINIEELHDSPDNYFEINGIEELAESILAQGGIKENLIVCSRSEGGYEIISGHRRKAAVQYLIDKGELVPHQLPCLVQSYADDSEKNIDLILMNLTQRVLSDAEMMKSFEKLDAIFKDKKEKGEKFGKTRQRIAEMLNISTGQVSKMENITKNAVPEVVDAVKSGDITIHTADKIASLDTDEQKEIIKDKSEPITPKKVKQKKAEKKAKEEKEEKVTVNDSEIETIEGIDDYYDFTEDVSDDVFFSVGSENADDNNANVDNVLKEQALDVIEKFTVSLNTAKSNDDIINVIDELRSEINKVRIQYLTKN